MALSPNHDCFVHILLNVNCWITVFCVIYLLYLIWFHFANVKLGWIYDFSRGVASTLGSPAELMVYACRLSLLLHVLNGVVKMKHLLGVFAFVSVIIFTIFFNFLASPKRGWKPSHPPQIYPGWVGTTGIKTVRDSTKHYLTFLVLFIPKHNRTLQRDFTLH